MALRVNTFSVLFIALCCLLFTNCGKKGCTDSNAATYNSKAKKDDGTCRYMGSLVFWISDSSAQEMVDDGVQGLTVYINGDIEGQISLTGQNFTEAPECGATNALTVERDLLSARTKAFSYRILDDQSVKRWAGAMTMNGNTCEKFELVYFP
jgi:hypothetical protein